LETFNFVDKILPMSLSWLWAICVENRWIHKHQNAVVTLDLIKVIFIRSADKTKLHRHKTIYDTDVTGQASEAIFE